MVVFEEAGHGIYDEDTDRFFAILREFIENLPDIPQADLDSYAESLAAWDGARVEAPTYVLRAYGWDRSSSEKIAAEYTRGWSDRLHESRDFLRLGFALYDVAEYEDALFVFERMQPATASGSGDDRYVALALIWQGHMLDLLGRREEAVERYRSVVDLDLDDSWSHGQYGLSYEIGPWAEERLTTPFQRVENRDTG